MYIKGCEIISNEPLRISNFSSNSEINLFEINQKINIEIDKNTNLILNIKNIDIKELKIKVNPNIEMQITTLFSGEKNHALINYVLEKNSNLTENIFDLKSENTNLIREIDLQGKNSNIKISHGIIALEKDNKIIKDTFKHNGHNSQANIKIFGIARDESSIEIDTIGKIQKGIKNCQSHQEQKVIIFDKKAQAKTNPILLIGDGDVKASHASTIGKVDLEHLYYLQTRGISKKQAKQMIIKGLLVPIINKINQPKIKKQIETEIKELL